ncbi:MAG TPA: serine/threonine-protein kinase [Polyangiaceae bacterium]|nr:serine/threonine-protein kinase [Polyangiaceae bacterium]
MGHVIDGKYRVDRAVDEGTFGVVYQAHHLKFDEKVALKCLKLPAGLRGAALEEFCRRFVAEGRFLHRLSRANTNIVQALDVGAELVAGGVWVPYLVLEWLDGVSLADDLEQRAQRGEGGRGLDGAIALLEPAAHALATAHEQRVAHRDVKPANLFLTTVAGRPTLKVLDFGIAQFADVVDSVEEGSAQAGDREGAEAFCAFSPFYAAPEQFDRAYGATGPKTDVYSLALVLVEVASGRPAIEGRSIGELFQATSDPDVRPTLRARGVDCSEAVEAVMRRALSPRPADRFETIVEFWQALEHAAGRSVAQPANAFASLTSLSAISVVANVQPAGPDAASQTNPHFRVGTDGGASASTGEHPASDETGSTAPNAPEATKARRAGHKLGKLAAVAVGAALTVAAVQQGSLPALHAASSLEDRAPRASRLDASAASGLGSRLLSRSDAAPAAPPATPKPGEREAAAAPSPLAGRDAASPSPPAGGALTRAGAGPAIEGAGDFTVRSLGRGASLDYLGAARECAKEGMSLCTEAQWQIACEARSPVGASQSWTATANASEGAVVRGGPGGCGARGLRPAAQALKVEAQACCAPALVGSR